MPNFVVTCPKGHIMEDQKEDLSVMVMDLQVTPIFLRYYCGECGEWYEIEIKERKELWRFARNIKNRFVASVDMAKLKMWDTLLMMLLLI